MPNVIEKDLGWRRILQEVQKAHNRVVAVGVFEGKKNSEGANIAEYGSFNEFGTDKIPSRPFMRTSFDEAKPEIEADIKQETDRLVTGKTTAHIALTRIGLKHKSRVQNTITERNFLPKLSAQTIKRKKGSAKTLVDTGALVNAIAIEVRNK